MVTVTLEVLVMRRRLSQLSFCLQMLLSDPGCDGAGGGIYILLVGSKVDVYSRKVSTLCHSQAGVTRDKAKWASECDTVVTLFELLYRISS